MPVIIWGNERNGESAEAVSSFPHCEMLVFTGFYLEWCVIFSGRNKTPFPLAGRLVLLTLTGSEEGEEEEKVTSTDIRVMRHRNILSIIVILSP